MVSISTLISIAEKLFAWNNWTRQAEAPHRQSQEMLNSHNM